ncbi:F-box/kelch-repeat protein [Raphanus sativus]|uniref:F-box/kelch-repeat protein At2g44700 n=1 Tax=Raphanus sativus TaxID=3726 RepID=A0A6J0JR10_RAPSA|nr:F-box/kelch-repeat protein At2g44700 [Raphanus sativus]KAJ4890826.1 F-box/kelch-repeat protein [Raphanus sativus]
MSPSSSFSSLPVDIVLEILARVPKRYHPTLSCVSKNFCLLLRSPEIHKIRSLRRRDSLFICFLATTNKGQVPHWFTLRRAENNPRENHFVSIDLTFPCQTEQQPCVVALGPELFFICGSVYPSSTMWVLDSRTGTFRQGPSSRAARIYLSVGVVGSKVYVMGVYRSDDEINVESFDVKTQTWELAHVPEDQDWWRSAAATVSLNRKVCVPRFSDNAIKCYDTRDGSCESLDCPTKGEFLCRTGACVMNNVLYVYYARFGLMWFDSEMRLWRVVNGLTHLNNRRSVAVAEYYGKLAFLWEEEVGVSGETKEVWCRMIALERSEGEVRGIAEAPQLLGSVPRWYRLQYCLSVSD